MELPTCKICGERHRLGGCPKFRKADVELLRKAVKRPPKGLKLPRPKVTVRRGLSKPG